MEKYKKIIQIGRGSSGVVWKAMNKHTGEVVAVKKLIDDVNEDCKNVREVKALIKIVNHPNIVKLKEIIKHNNTLFLIFEYMESDLYKRMVRRTQPFSEPEIRNMCFQILQGLAYMHNKGYMHRDLKPDNILVSNNIIKIGDLGSARETNGQQPYTHDNVTTLWYRAPEAFLRSPVYDSSVDMWAFGAIMAELYTNQPVFDGGSEAEVMLKICCVLGTPTESTWSSGLDLAKNALYRFPDFPGVGFSELIPTASSDAVNLIASLLTWCPCDRPTAMEALQHPFFNGCYHMPPIIHLENRL